ASPPPPARRRDPDRRRPARPSRPGPGRRHMARQARARPGALAARRLHRRADPPDVRATRPAPRPALRGGEPPRRLRQHRHGRHREGGARRLLARPGHDRQPLHQPVRVQEHGPRPGARPRPGRAHLGNAQRRRGVAPARARGGFEGLHRLGQGEARRHHLRLAGRDDHGAPVGRAPGATLRVRGHARAVSRRGAPHPDHALGRPELRHRQPRQLPAHHPGRAAPRPRRDQRRALAQPAERAHHGRGRRAGLRRDLLVHPGLPRRRAAPDRGPLERRHPPGRGGSVRATAVPAGRRQGALVLAGGRGRPRRQGATALARPRATHRRADRV
ncbi:MAG: BUG/TctC family periplasmic protein, partial [uncultured Acetobacteraceae bacterium]